MAVASCCWMLRVVTAYVPRLGHRESTCTSQDTSERAAECSFVRRYLRPYNRKMRILLSDGHCQLLHVVGAVMTTSASPGHRESVCTSSVMCGRAAESVSAAAGSLAAVAAHLLLCPFSPLFQAARPSCSSFHTTYAFTQTHTFVKLKVPHPQGSNGFGFPAFLSKFTSGRVGS